MAGIGFGGTGLGWIIWKAHQIYNKLENGEKKREAKAATEESIVREQLLNKYKELWEVEKARSERDIQELRREMEKLRVELERLTVLTRELIAERDRLLALNLKYQRDAMEKQGN